MNSALKGLYGISDNILTPRESICAQVQEAIKGGMRIFQFRDKTSDDSDIVEIIYQLMDICATSNVLFVLNDRVELAISLKCPALHIGKDDGDIQSIRKHFKGILGVSSYGDLARAKILEKNGADYIAFGAMFPSSTKPNTKCVGMEILSCARESLSIPICAIGGISKDNIKLLKNADMFAVISALWNGSILHNENACRNAKDLCKNTPC